MEENQSDMSGLGPAPSGKLDANEIAGRKVKVAKVYAGVKVCDYDDDGNYVQGLQREAPVVYFETEPITDGKVVEPVVIRERINLKTNTTWSTSPKSGMMKLFKKYRINRPEEMVGKEVMLLARPGNDDTVWPAFELE